MVLQPILLDIKKLTKMELPYYPRFLVRQFAGPILRYPKEYQEAMRLIGVKSWTALKETLSSKDADKIVEHVNAYIKHARVIEECYQSLSAYNMPYADYARVCAVLRESENQRFLSRNKMLGLKLTDF
jgi:hypothetical protein